MRTHRFLTGLLGLALAGLLPTGVTAAASAAPAPAPTTTATSVGGTAPATAERAPAKPRRDLNDRSVNRRGTYYIVGRVTPDGARKAVVFKRKLSKQAPWRVWRKVRADGKGRFSIAVQFPQGTRATWFYKGVVYGGQDYADSPTKQIYVACRRVRC